MAGNDEGRFRIKPAAPKSRGGPRSQRFVSQVLKQLSKRGEKKRLARALADPPTSSAAGVSQPP